MSLTEWNKSQVKRLPLIEGKGIGISNLYLLFEKDEIRKGELPSANHHATARGMAALAAIMANKGKRINNEKTPSNDKKTNDTLVSENTWRKMHDDQKLAMDALFSKYISNNP